MIFDDTAAATWMRQWHRDCGKRLAVQRRDAKHSQATLSGRAGVGQATISRIELGVHAPSDAVKVRLAAALDRELGDIWPPIPTATFRAAALKRQPDATAGKQIA